MTGSNVKLVVNKGTTDKFARNSPTLNHIYKYPVVSKSLDRFVSLPIVSQILSLFVVSILKAKHAVVDSDLTPQFVKVAYNFISGVSLKIDELINLLVFREGIDALLSSWKSHSGKPGLWILYFWVDYVANVSNILLTLFIVKPFKLSDSTSLKEKLTSESTDETLPHVTELTSTTKSISKDIQDKLHSDYIGPTTDFAKQKYDTLVKPTADKLQSDYIEPTKAQLDSIVKPTRASALETYKTVSATYESNLNKSESIPRAIITTGIDLKNLTLENLKSNRSELEKDAKEKAEIVKEAIEEQVAQVSAATTNNKK